MSINIRKLLGQLAGQQNTLTIPRWTLTLTGNDHTAALFLSQLLYWCERASPDRDGWIAKSAIEWEEELGLTSYQVNRATKKLQLLGFPIETKTAKSPFHSGAPTKHYRINLDAVVQIFQSGFQETSKLISNKLENPISENTSENTLKDSSSPKEGLLTTPENSSIEESINLSTLSSSEVEQDMPPDAGYTYDWDMKDEATMDDYCFDEEDFGAEMPAPEQDWHFDRTLTLDTAGDEMMATVQGPAAGQGDMAENIRRLGEEFRAAVEPGEQAITKTFAHIAALTSPEVNGIVYCDQHGNVPEINGHCSVCEANEARKEWDKIQTEAESDKKRNKTTLINAHNAMKDAIVAAFGWERENVTDVTWGIVNKASKELRDVGALPEDMPALYAFCKAKDWDDFTPRALSGRWAEFKATNRHTDILEHDDSQPTTIAPHYEPFDPTKPMMDQS